MIQTTLQAAPSPRCWVRRSQSHEPRIQRLNACAVWASVVILILAVAGNIERNVHLVERQVQNQGPPRFLRRFFVLPSVESAVVDVPFGSSS